MRNGLFRTLAALTFTLAPAAGASIIADGPGLGVTTDWAGVGKVGGASSFYGTGALIGTPSAPTAAPLVEGLGQPAARFEVDGHIYTSTAIAIHPNYDGGDQFDVAVITLALDVPANVP